MRLADDVLEELRAPLPGGDDERLAARLGGLAGFYGLLLADYRPSFFRCSSKNASMRSYSSCQLSLWLKVCPSSG